MLHEVNFSVYSSFIYLMCSSPFLSLIFSDCSSEVIVKYGLDFHVSLHDNSEPVRVGFRHSTVEANQTSLPADELLNADGTPKDNYQDRVEITPQKFTLRAVTGADEGSYTFSDSIGKVQKKICLNVKGESGKQREWKVCTYIIFK